MLTEVLSEALKCSGPSSLADLSRKDEMRVGLEGRGVVSFLCVNGTVIRKGPDYSTGLQGKDIPVQLSLHL